MSTIGYTGVLEQTPNCSSTHSAKPERSVSSPTANPARKRQRPQLAERLSYLRGNGGVVLVV